MKDRWSGTVELFKENCIEMYVVVGVVCTKVFFNVFRIIRREFFGNFISKLEK